jgi:hypothetical protein
MAASVKIGDTVTIRLSGTCWGGDRSHHPSEHGLRGWVEHEDPGNDHPLFVRFRDSHVTGDGLPVGRWFSANELDANTLVSHAHVVRDQEVARPALKAGDTIAYNRLRERHRMEPAHGSSAACLTCGCAWPCEVGRALEIVRVLLRG